MRQQAIEKVLRLIIDEHWNGSRIGPRMTQLVRKAEIVLDRSEGSAERQASVIRELTNERV